MKPNDSEDFMSDVEIVEKIRKDYRNTVEQGERLFGALSDSMGVFRYRSHEWMTTRSKIRPIHDLTDRYGSDAMLAREMAGLGLAHSSMASLMHVEAQLRTGLLFPIAALFRVIDELFTDATFVRLDTSGTSAIRMFDWQVADTAKVEPDNPVRQTEFTTMKTKYQNDPNYGKPGAWALLPNGKKYYSFDARKCYVLKEIENETLPEAIEPESWQLLTDMARTHRAQTNTTVHASPIAVTQVDDYFAMGVQSALYAAMTVASFRWISDDQIARNLGDTSTNSAINLLSEDEAAWRQVIVSALQMGVQIQEVMRSDVPQ